MNKLKLSVEIIFPDLNKAKCKDQFYAKDESKLQSLKYKYLRDIQKFPERDQVHRLMLKVTDFRGRDLANWNSLMQLKSVVLFTNLSANIST